MTTRTETPAKVHRPIVFACSGAADVGEIADRAARLLAKDGAAAMSCLAGVSANVDKIMADINSAPALVAIDGCPQNCAAKTLANADVALFGHVRLSDLGMEKGKSPASVERVAAAAEAAEQMIRTQNT